MPLLGLEDELDLLGPSIEGEEDLAQLDGDVVEMGEDDGSLFGAESVARRGGMRLSREVVLPITGSVLPSWRAPPSPDLNY